MNHPSRLPHLVGAVVVVVAALGCGGGSAASGGAPAPTARPAPVQIGSLGLDATWTQLAPAFAYDASPSVVVSDTGTPEVTDGVTVRDVTYLVAGWEVPAYLVVPAGKGPFAAVLFSNWLGQHNSDRTEFLDEAKALAKHGVVSLLPTRRFPGIDRPADWRSDREALVRQDLELRRGLDLLAAQPGVDRSRVGFVGHDYGAMHGALLVAVDPRVKAAVLMTPTSTWVAWNLLITAVPAEGRDEYARGLKSLDPVEVLGQTSAAKLMLQFGGQDGFVPADVADSIVKACGTGCKPVTYADDGHELSDKALSDRDAWLLDELGLQ